MRLRWDAAAFAVAAMTGGSACAMNTSETPTCHVTGGGSLSPDSGGEAALCKAVAIAIAHRSGVKSVDIRILRNASLARAVVTLEDGRALPAVNVASMDRRLNADSFKMLADSVAAQVAKEAGE